MNKLYTSVFSVFTLFLISGANSFGQGITKRDSDEIRLQAKRKIERSLLDFMNFLTLNDTEESERIGVINKNLAESNDIRLFYNKDVIIEDDLQPDRPIDQIFDVKIEKYLANLDLLYTKSPEYSIVFTDCKVSNVKERVYPYVKVYYTQLFKGKNNQSTASFRAVPRVAEVRATQYGKKWVVNISQIGFVQPGDSVGSTINDIKLIEPVATLDSNALQEQKEKEALQEALREQEREKERMRRAVFEEHLAKGKKAQEAMNFPGAIMAFQEAEKYASTDGELYTIKSRVTSVKNLIDAAKIAERELMRDYQEKADLARKKRQYSEALSFYHKILEKKPDSVAVLNLVKELTQKASSKTEYDEQFAAGQFAQLKKAYDDIIKKDPGNSDWYLGRAKTYLKLAEEDRALRDLTKSIELDYANLEALQTRGELYHKMNNLPKAIADYSAYLIIDPKNDRLFWQRGLLRIKTNNTGNAESDFTQAISLDKKQAQYYYDRGLLRFRNQKLDEAASDLTSAIENAPGKAEPYFWRGLVSCIQKQYAPAGIDFANARKNKADNDYIARMDSVAFSLYSLGKAANDEKKYAQAIPYLTDALTVQSSLPKALYERGVSHLNLGEYAEAVTDLTASLTLLNNEASTYDRRAEAYMMQRNFEQAATDYHKSNDLFTLNYASKLGEATALIELKRYEEAIRPLLVIKEAKRKIEKNYQAVFFRDVFYRLGVSEYHTNQFDKAVDDFSESLKFEEGYSYALFDRARSYEAQGKLKQAIEDYQAAVNRNTNEPSWRFAHANALEKNGDNQLAIVAYGIVIQTDTTQQLHSVAKYRRGLNAFMIGQYTEALTDLEQPSIQTDTSLCKAECWLRTGEANIYVGKSDVGISYLAKCLSTPAYAPKAAYATACAFLQKDNVSEAMSWFEKSLKDKAITASEIKKDKLIDVVKKDFRKDKAFRQLVDKYSK